MINATMTTSTRTETYGLLEAWLRQWEELLVHQALTSMTNVSLYTDELEEIFEEAVVKLSNDAIRQIPACSSIRDLIEKYEEMWIS